MAGRLARLATLLGCAMMCHTYDILMLSSDWPPSTCITDAEAGYPCSTAPWGAFSIADLNPVNLETDDPTSCEGLPAYDPAAMTQADLHCYFNSFSGSNEVLWRDMWAQRGTCAEFASQADYFSFGMAAAKKYDINAVLGQATIMCGGSVDRDALRAELKRQWGVDVWITCDTKSSRRNLAAVEVCLDPNNKADPTAISCPFDPFGDGMGGAECAGTLYVPTGANVPSYCPAFNPPCYTVPPEEWTPEVAQNSTGQPDQPPQQNTTTPMEPPPTVTDPPPPPPPPTDLPTIQTSFVCTQQAVLPETIPASTLEVTQGVFWEDINFLNPSLPWNATELPAGTTLCLAHGPNSGLTPVAEPALPAWLPPWSSQDARQARLEAACQASGRQLPPGYAAATLCANSAPSSLLAATLANELAGSCGARCAYNPVPPTDDDALSEEALFAWRWDAENTCWLQATRRNPFCTLDSQQASGAAFAAKQLQYRKVLADFLAASTASGAADLPVNFAGSVQGAWAAFYGAGDALSAEDPTGSTAASNLGGLMADGLASGTVRGLLVSLPAGDPMLAAQEAMGAASREDECLRATGATLAAAACLCNPAEPYLHCTALITKEINGILTEGFVEGPIQIDSGTMSEPTRRRSLLGALPVRFRGCSAPEIDFDVKDIKSVVEFIMNPLGRDISYTCKVEFQLNAAVALVVALTPAMKGFLATNEIEKVQAHTLPACGDPQDPLASFSAAQLEDLKKKLDSDASLKIGLCLKGGTAVSAVSKLAKYFNLNLAEVDNEFCLVDITMTYKPQKGEGSVSLELKLLDMDPEEGSWYWGPKIATELALQLKIDSVMGTPACDAATKSPILDSIVKCEDYCRIPSWSFEEFKWKVVFDVPVFGKAENEIVNKPRSDADKAPCQPFFKPLPTCPSLPPPSPPPPLTDEPIVPPPPSPPPNDDGTTDGDTPVDLGIVTDLVTGTGNCNDPDLVAAVEAEWVKFINAETGSVCQPGMVNWAAICACLESDDSLTDPDSTLCAPCYKEAWESKITQECTHAVSKAPSWGSEGNMLFSLCGIVY